MNLLLAVIGHYLERPVKFLSNPANYGAIRLIFHEGRHVYVKVRLHIPERYLKRAFQRVFRNSAKGDARMKPVATFAMAAAAMLISLSPAAAEGTYALDNEARILSGEAFGDAALADETGYPDPELVIKWAVRLGLSDNQLSAVTKIHDAMLADARDIAPEYVRLEHELHALFKGGRAGTAKVRALTADIAELSGRLRFIHLDARLRMRFELTRDQLRAYNRIRAGEG